MERRRHIGYMDMNMMNINLLGYTYKIFNSGYNTEMVNKQCNARDPREVIPIEDHLPCEFMLIQ